MTHRERFKYDVPVENIAAIYCGAMEFYGYS